MSRSYKKTPIFTVCDVRHGAQKKWKVHCNKKFRRNISIESDMPSGTKYKKIFQTIWDSPSDGKYWRGNPRRQNCLFKDQNLRLNSKDMRK